MNSKGKQKYGTGSARKNLSKSKVRAPNPKEWDFRACPVDELFPCVIYEYARESDDFCRGFEAWKGTVPKGEIGCVVVAVWDGITFSLRSDCREFPKTPWLEIAPKRRQCIFDSSLKFSGLAFRRVNESWGTGLDYESGEEIDLFEISWAWPNTKIVEDFKMWLKENRPKSGSFKQNAAEYLGKGKAPRKRELLNALGALRWLKIHTAEDAETLTQTFLGDDPLYSEASAWSRAKRNAVDLLKRFSWELPPSLS